MLQDVFAIHPGLDASGRLPSLSRREQGWLAAELGVLVMLGLAAAALSGLVKLSLGIPGHNIIRVVFPMALGLAMVPRRGAATVMGLGGLIGAGGLHAAGASGLGAGATTSLVLTGFLLDAALIGARSGQQVYVRLALAGLGANLLALAVRLAEKSLLGTGLEGGPVAVWLPKAAVTYCACGLIAGLISAAAWFRFAPAGRGESDAPCAP